MDIELKDRRILLIGGAGFIGHNLALELKRQGASVAILDGLEVNNLLSFAGNTSTAHPNAALYYKMVNKRLELIHENKIPLYVQDARDYLKLNQVYDAFDPQVVVHLAAVAHAGRANKDPQSTFDHSFRTLENALDCCRGRKVEHFLFFSSSMAYGDFQSASVTEEHPLKPIGIYGALKAGGELIVKSYQQVFDLPYTIIRPSALYGPRCVSRRVGQIFIENALQDKTMRVDGDGSDRLDFTYIEDLIQGISRSITCEKAKNETFNLTFGESRSIKDLLDVILTHYPDLKVDYAERDRLMPKRGTLDITKAKELLGYSPANPIEVGFKKYIDAYKGMGFETQIFLNVDG